jgi:hypothetical protein
MIGFMSAAPSKPQDASPDDDPDRRPVGTDQPHGAAPFDWQVLLMRYLPQPVGSTHVIKRLAPR